MYVFELSNRFKSWACSTLPLRHFLFLKIPLSRQNRKWRESGISKKINFINSGLIKQSFYSTFPLWRKSRDFNRPNEGDN